MELHVDLADRTYGILIEKRAFGAAIDKFRALAREGARLACVADAAVARLHPKMAAQMREIAEVIEVEGGEASKCFARAADICSLLARAKLDRKSALLAWGGGVIGDLAGFAASIYMRGIDFYQIPTTLLAMVDSSVGGKTAINIPEGKNLVGAFHQPRGVFADTDFLETLPAREFAAGMAEVIKCGVIGDAELFEKLESLGGGLSPVHPYLPEAIRRACALKARIVAEDERETAPEGGRALLNLGHTFGHAIEKTCGFGTYLHGEAVAVGMVMAARLSADLGGEDFCARLEGVLKKSGLPARIPKKISVGEFMEAMSLDKKSEHGRLKFVIPAKIGASKTLVAPLEAARRAVESFLQ